MSSRDEIVDVFARVTDPERMARLFKEVFTDHERHDLALRWELMKRLHAGVPQREVSEELGVSLCKITRGSRVLKDDASECRRLLDQRRTK